VSVRALELLAQGRLTEAIEHAQHAVRIARSRTADELANALGDQAVIYAVVGVPDRATAAVDEAVGCLWGRATTPEGVVAAGAIALALVNLERFQDAVDLLDGVDIPPAASPPPARFRLTLGWACLGAGHFSRALRCFVDAIPPPTRKPVDQGPADRHGADRHGADRHSADRHSAETLLGVGCTLAAIGHDDAAPALAGALELLARVDYRSPPALERAIARARAQVDHRSWPRLADEPTEDLLERLERDVRSLGVGSADSRSAAG
jgi:tetratricopeptide (TPR) repeat protein